MAELGLPDWVKFDPANKFLWGIAPKTGYIAQIKLRAMNTLSHDSLTTELKIIVVKSKEPRVNIIHFDHDLDIPLGRFFEYTFPEDLFDYDSELGPKFVVQMSSGGLWPKDFTFSPENRTISGLAQQAGTFRVDYIFSDDLGHKAYTNLLLRV